MTPPTEEQLAEWDGELLGASDIGVLAERVEALIPEVRRLRADRFCDQCGSEFRRGCDCSDKVAAYEAGMARVAKLEAVADAARVIADWLATIGRPAPELAGTLAALDGEGKG